MREVIIIGGGPAGLSAALILGRCRRSALVVDAGEPRNGVSRGLHGFLTRDGVSPAALRALGRRELAAYPSVEYCDGRVQEVRRLNEGFAVRIDAGRTEYSRLLLLATGRTDPLPDRPGFREYYGKGVYHCPYCDGWEHRDQRLAVYGSGRAARVLAEELLIWSRDVTICTDGDERPVAGEPIENPVMSRAISLRKEPVESLEGGETGLERIRFTTGLSLACDALFFVTECPQRSPLPEQLGCRFNDDRSVVCEKFCAAGVPGVFLAGNVRGGLHLAITAAAEGAEAAVAINEALGLG